MEKTTARFRRLLALALVLVCWCTAGWGAAAAETLIEGEADALAFDQAELIEYLRWWMSDESLDGDSYHLEYDYSITRCDPAHFLSRMQTAMSIADEANREVGMRSVLARFGFDLDAEEFERFSLMWKIELIECGQVSSLEGDAWVSLVQMYGDRRYFDFVFVRRSSGWYLTDLLMPKEAYGKEAEPLLQFLRHSEGKPGAWLRVRSEAHGTGLYVDYRQWYNVFTRQYDLAYIREGYDDNSVMKVADADMHYTASWKTDLGFTADKIEDELHFITYESITRLPIRTDRDWIDGQSEEVSSTMTQYIYLYDQQTASFVRAHSQRLPLMNPARGEMMWFLYGNYSPVDWLSPAF
jgi:hypothetical protein